MWEGVQVFFEVFIVFVFEFQYQFGVCVEGGDSRCYVVGEGKLGYVKDKCIYI